ncbi:MAG: type II toxin-antitoxin system VapC family toxin [Chloroflexota bacterium]|nr:type II toxin-antitoxin system VapC family toxin [Chloroflexota bacterium]
MSRLIVDASATLTFLLDDEWDERAESAFEWVDREGGCVPQHWHYEVRNGLLVNVRRARLTQDDALRRLSSLRRFRWETDSASDLESALELAFEHVLTFYDALYLELAIRRAMPLVTLDNDLATAASRAGVEVLVT